jgi:hypothetical protein
MKQNLTPEECLPKQRKRYHKSRPYTIEYKALHIYFNWDGWSIWRRYETEAQRDKAFLILVKKATWCEYRKGEDQ